MFQTANPAVSTTPNAIKTFTSASPTFTGTITTPITGAGAQCVQASAGGVLSGTGSACGAGGGGSPGGTNTDVQFNNSSAFGGDAGFTYAGNGQATLALGTITTNLKALNITGTWNAAGVTFDAPLFMNITNTASAAGSLLMDLQVGSASKFQVQKTGDTVIPDSTGFYASGLGINGMQGSGSFLTFFANSNAVLQVDSSVGNIVIRSNLDLAWGGVGAFGSPDIQLYRDASGVLAQRSSTTAQTFRVYNTFTDASNYERGVFDWGTSSNILTIGTQAAGTGTARNLKLVAGSASALFDTTADITLTGSAANFIFVPSGTHQWSVGPIDVSGSPYFFWYDNTFLKGPFAINATARIAQVPPEGGFGWSNGTNAWDGPLDTIFYRAAVAVVSVQGASSAGGTLRFIRSTPSTLASGSTNNYDPGNESYFQRLTANAANSTLTGLAPNSAAQVDGEVHVIINVAASATLTLANQNAGSTATNRFLNSTGADIVLSANQAADLIYDGAATRWLVFKRN
jgi:hypothetical protein